MSDTVQSIKSQLTRITRVAFRKSTLFAAALAFGGYELAKHPPIGNIDRGEVGIRLNRLTGATTQSGEGAMLVIPGLHELRLYSLQDQMYHPERSSKADGGQRKLLRLRPKKRQPRPALPHWKTRRNSMVTLLLIPSTFFPTHPSRFWTGLSPICRGCRNCRTSCRQRCGAVGWR